MKRQLRVPVVILGLIILAGFSLPLSPPGTTQGIEEMPAKMGVAQQSTGHLEVVGQTFGGRPRAVTAQGDYAYVAVGRWLVVLDISDAAAPTVVGRTAVAAASGLRYEIRRIAVTGDLAVVYARADDLVQGGSSLRIIDIADPTAPEEVGSFEPASVHFDVAGNYAYVADGRTLRVIDLSVPHNPLEVSTSFRSAGAWVIQAVGNYVFIASVNTGLHIIAASDPTSPEEVGVYEELGIRGLYVTNDYAYVTTFKGLQVVDISDPTAPEKVGSYASDPDVPEGMIYVAGEHAYFYSSSFSRQATLHVINVSDPTAPWEVGTYDDIPQDCSPTPSGTSCNALNLYVAGDYALVVGKSLYVIDVSNPAEPVQANVYSTVTAINDVYVTDDPSRGQAYAFVAAGESGLRIFDVSDLSMPVEIGAHAALQDANGVFIAGHYAYVADAIRGLVIVDISDPAVPVEAGFVATSGIMKDVHVNEDYAYVVGEGFQVIDVSDPSDPVSVSTADSTSVESVYISGNYAYLADVGAGGLRIMDISDPTRPSEVSSYQTPDRPQSIYVKNSNAYVAARDAGLRVIDVSNPAAPEEMGFCNKPRSANSVSVAGNYAYVADALLGLWVVDISHPTAPVEVGYHETLRSALKVHATGERIYLVDGMELAILRFTPPATRPTVTPMPTPLAGSRTYVPALRVIGGQTVDVHGWIEVQNIGTEPAVAELIYWGASEGCASPQMDRDYSDVLSPGMSWRWTTASLPSWAQSAQVEAYTDTPARGGQSTDVPLAVSVGRSAPSPAGGVSQPLLTGYTAISTHNLGAVNADGQYDVAVPGIYAGFEGHNSWLNIQNAGDVCANVTLVFNQRDECNHSTTCEISGLAPGESRTFDVGACVPPGFEGSVRALSGQPLAMVADAITLGRVAGSHVASPMNVTSPETLPGRTHAYGTISFREQRGWETSAVVQNVDSDRKARVKVYFLTNEGDHIKTSLAWVCPKGNQIVSSDVVSNIKVGGRLGRILVHSESWKDSSGWETNPVSIAAAIRLTKYADQSKGEALQQASYNLGAVQLSSAREAIALPGLFRDFRDITSPIATLTSRVVIANWNKNPGAARVALDLLGNGCVAETITKELDADQMMEIDLADETSLPAGWRGSGILRLLETTQVGDVQLSAIIMDRLGPADSGPISLRESIPVSGDFPSKNYPTCAVWRSYMPMLSRFGER